MIGLFDNCFVFGWLIKDGGYRSGVFGVGLESDNRCMLGIWVVFWFGVCGWKDVGVVCFGVVFL